MTARPRVPAGRAGRLWLVERRALASKAVALLDTKVRLLQRELNGFEAAEAEADRQWIAACRTAARWQARALVGAAVRDLRLAQPQARAVIDIETASVMGVRYPAAVTCVPPGHPEQLPWTGSSALPATAAAYERALEVGARLAAARAARRAIAYELAVTSQRLHALRDRWLPALDDSLRALDAALDEQERADSARLRGIRPRLGTTGPDDAGR